MNKLSILFKKIFRNIYYKFVEGRTTVIKKPEILNGFKWIESKRFGIAYSHGNYEVDLLAQLSKFLSPQYVFIDVGGHAGYVALFASRLCKQVFTFEPEKANFAFIEKIIQLNSIENIRPYNLAIGAIKAKLKFEQGLTSSMGGISETGDTEVQVMPLDEFIFNGDIERVDGVKIDVEGFGAKVLEGMNHAIQNYKPFILFEIHNQEEILAIKSLRGYTFITTNDLPVIWDSLPNQFVIALPIKK
ncbi:MAG: FkbM family methyltransferase [Cyclobacteriaceae bacterium]|nr:FkbM family methyltransferase [Cyclobacteriaceae bacterium]